MSDLDTRLREALHELAPAQPATDGLADGARHYAARARRARQLGVAGATAAILVAAGLLLGSFDPPTRVVPAGPFLTPADCTRQARVTTIASVNGPDLAGLRAAWVCPDATPAGTQTSNGTDNGWILPTDRITGRQTGMLNLLGRSDQWPCGTGRPGPAFTVTVESGTGQLRTFRSRELACDGSRALASFLNGLAEEEADVRARSASRPQYACRGEQSWLTTRKPGSLTHELHSPFVAATFCLAPSFLSGDPVSPVEPLTARSYRSIPVPSDTLAQLNADVSSRWPSFFGGNEGCSGEGHWTYSIVGVTEAGDERRLSTACLDELWVRGVNRTGFIPSAQTTAALRALVPPS